MDWGLKETKNLNLCKSLLIDLAFINEIGYRLAAKWRTLEDKKMTILRLNSVGF